MYVLFIMHDFILFLLIIIGCKDNNNKKFINMMRISLFLINSTSIYVEIAINFAMNVEIIKFTETHTFPLFFSSV